MKRTVLAVAWGILLIAIVSGTALAVQTMATRDCSADPEAKCKGSSGDDRITGDTTRDLIRALQGKDTVEARAGDDTVEGNQNADLIDGGEGDDELRGGRGNDTINDFGSTNPPTTTTTGSTTTTTGSTTTTTGPTTTTTGPTTTTTTQLDDADVVFGGKGNDVINVRDQDGNDTVDCGQGDSDRVMLDDDDEQSGCELGDGNS